MTHVRGRGKRSKHRASDCKKGRHDFDEPQNIGAGIVRQVCKTCAAVRIDLTRADQLTAPYASVQKSPGRRTPDSEEPSKDA